MIELHYCYLHLLQFFYALSKWASWKKIFLNIFVAHLKTYIHCLFCVTLFFVCLFSSYCFVWFVFIFIRSTTYKSLNCIYTVAFACPSVFIHPSAWSQNVAHSNQENGVHAQRRNKPRDPCNYKHFDHYYV